MTTKKATSIEKLINDTEASTELFAKVSTLSPAELNLTMLINEYLAPLVNKSNGWTTDGIKVIPTILTIQTYGVRKTCAGHYLQDAYTSKSTGESYAEIQISAEHMNRPIGDIMATNLHEAVHLCAAQHYGFTLDDNDRDCTKDASHRKDGFKRFAEAITIDGKPAFVVTKGKKGWDVTTATPELLAYFETLPIDLEAYDIFRNTPEPKPKKTNVNVKYACACTEPKRSFHATTPINATCYDCDTDFIAQ